MYNFCRPKNTYPRWGRYFSTVPTFPIEEQGVAFSFAWATASQNAMDDLVPNFEHLSVDETIKTPNGFRWSLEGAVLIDGELYKIIDTQTTRVPGASHSLVRDERTETSVRLKRISNPIGMR